MSNKVRRRPSHSQRIEQSRGAARRRRRGLWIGAVTVGVVAVAVAVAAVVSNPGNGSFESGDVVVEGTALAPFTSSVDDPAVGEASPVVSGVDTAGAPLTIGARGEPQLIGFLAHWCSHCQAEVTELSDHFETAGLPDDVAVYGVLTRFDRTRGNWPPDQWLADEGWTIPTLVDSADDAAADAFGMSGTPFWVAVDADGKVVSRVSGQLGAAGLEALAADAAGASSTSS